MTHFCSSCISFAELAAARWYQAVKRGSAPSFDIRRLYNFLSLPPNSAMVKNSLCLSTSPSSDPPFCWGYSDDNGPRVWPTYFAAGKGKRQSPIDIKTSNVKYDSGLVKNPLKVAYDDRSARFLVNVPYSFQVKFDESEENTISGGPLGNPYTLYQFHLHWAAEEGKGSEHTINGQSYSGELHMVHYNKEKYGNFLEAVSHPDGLAVLGVFLKVGNQNPELQKVVNHLPKLTIASKTVELYDRLNLLDMLPKSINDYWTYDGSLTTPPLAESVTWIVFPTPIEVSHWQLKAFRRLYPENWRPVMPLNDRIVKSTFIFK